MPARKSKSPTSSTTRRTTPTPKKSTTRLPQSMVTGKASPAKAAVGDQPVFDYIASLPKTQRQIVAWMKQVAAVPGVGRGKR